MASRTTGQAAPQPSPNTASPKTAPPKEPAAKASEAIGDTQPLDAFPEFGGLPSTPARSNWRKDNSPESLAHASGLGDVADAGLDLGGPSKTASIGPSSSQARPLQPEPASPAAQRPQSGDSLDEWANQQAEPAELGTDPLNDDWYAGIGARRWIWMGAAAAALVLLVFGLGWLWSGDADPALDGPAHVVNGDTSQPIGQATSNTPPQPTPTELPDDWPRWALAAGIAAGSQEISTEPGPGVPAAELPSFAAPWTPKWLPAETQTVVTVRPASLLAQNVFPVELADAELASWRGVGNLLKAFGLQPQQVERVSWALVAAREHEAPPGGLPAWSQRAVVCIELSAGMEDVVEPLLQTEPLGFELSNSDCRLLANDLWPYPYAVVAPNTVVTGPSELLQNFNAEAGNLAGLDSRPLKQLIPQIRAEDHWAWVAESAAFDSWLGDDAPVGLSGPLAQENGQTLLSVQGMACAIRCSERLEAGAYMLSTSEATAPQVAAALESLCLSASRQSDPPTWWPLAQQVLPRTQPGNPLVAKPSVKHVGLPQARRVDVQLVQAAAPLTPASEAKPLGFIPLAEPAPRPEANPAGNGAAEAAKAGEAQDPVVGTGDNPFEMAASTTLTGPESWEALQPLLGSAQIEAQGSLVTARFTLEREPAAMSTWALASLARLPREAAIPLADANPAAEPPPMVGEPEMPAEPDNSRPQFTAPQVDIDARLTDPVAAIQFQQVPVADALDVLSQMSTIPLAYDWPALQSSGFSPAKLVDFVAQDAKFGDLLTKLLASQGARWEPRESCLWITSGTKDADKARMRRYPVSDLFSPTAPDTAAVVQLVRQMVRPQSWQPRGPGQMIVPEGAAGKEDIEVTHDQAAHQAVALFLDKLRAARSKPPRAGSTLPGSPLQTRYSSVKASLGRTVTANFVQPTPLRRVLRYLQEQSGVRVVLDGSSLPSSVWGDRPVTLSATNQTVAEVLGNLAAELGVGWRIVDETTVEFLSVARLEAETETEFYRLAGLATAAEPLASWADRLKRAVEPQSWQATGPGAIVLDVPSQTLIIRHTQPAQFAIEGWLNEQAKAAPAP